MFNTILSWLFAAAGLVMFGIFGAVIMRSVESTTVPGLGLTDITMIISAVVLMAALDFVMELVRDSRKTTVQDPSEQRDQI
jgi:uncharacterized membrane protein